LCKQFLQYPYLWWDNCDQFAVWLTNIVIILPWLQSLGTDSADLFGRSLLQLPLMSMRRQGWRPSSALLFLIRNLER
jgi:hypothetical protein